jgi:hypothetical protein
MIEHHGGLCLYSRSGPGSRLALGATLFPLIRPIVLQGGTWLEAGSNPGGFVAAEGVPTLRPVAEPVPGGLPAIMDSSLLSGAALRHYEGLIRAGRTEVSATVELAAPASAITFSLGGLLNGKTSALTLPLRLRLRGAGHLLGSTCYLGSAAAPIVLHLTDGTTSPPPTAERIAGKIGVATESKSEVITIAENTLVENAFPLPSVEGCGEGASWGPEIDLGLNSRLGLPSPAGRNTAILESTLGAAAGTRVGAALCLGGAHQGCAGPNDEQRPYRTLGAEVQSWQPHSRR